VRRTIENLFELVEANIGAAVVAMVASLAITGCLHFLWEDAPRDETALYVSKVSVPENNSSGEATFAIRPSSVM
jgi:hypothetical protein